MLRPASDSKCPLCGGTGDHDFTGRDLMYDRPETYDYHQCSSCGLLYQHPLPSLETIATFYPDDYSIYRTPDASERRYSARIKARLYLKHGYRHLPIPLVQRLLSLLFPPFCPPIDFVPGGRALDIGCGNGQLLHKLSDLGWQCEGVEFNAKAVEICRSNGLKVFHGELEAAAFPDHSFDLVTAHHLIEHVRDPDRLLAEISRVLKPGGRLWLRTPNSRALGRNCFGSFWFPNETPRHLFLFSQENLDRAARRHGLRALYMTTIVKEKHVLKSMDYKLGNKGKPMKKRRPYKWLAKLYIPLAKLSGRGDELFAIYEKSAPAVRTGSS